MLAKTEWLAPLLDVDLGEALCLLSALAGVRDFKLGVYGSINGVSNYNTVINDCRHMLTSDLATFDVTFIWRQVNEVFHRLAMVTLYHASFHIYIKISSGICTLIIVEPSFFF